MQQSINVSRLLRLHLSHCHQQLRYWLSAHEALRPNTNGAQVLVNYDQNYRSLCDIKVNDMF